LPRRARALAKDVEDQRGPVDDLDASASEMLRSWSAKAESCGDEKVGGCCAGGGADLLDLAAAQ